MYCKRFGNNLTWTCPEVWTFNRVDLFLSGGGDISLRPITFVTTNGMFYRFTHLQHKPFTYRIGVQSNAAREATCRIFLAPKFDERGNPWLFRDQRLMFIELDRFKVNCKWLFWYTNPTNLVNFSETRTKHNSSQLCGLFGDHSFRENVQGFGHLASPRWVPIGPI